MLLESSFLHTQATSPYLGTTIKAKRGTKGQRVGGRMSLLSVLPAPTELQRSLPTASRNLSHLD